METKTVKLAAPIMVFLLLINCAWGDVVLNSSLKAWYDAGVSGRADVLILGDSTVLFGGDGWDAGVQRGLKSRMGIAGTGYLYGRSAGQGEGYYVGNSYSSAWSSSKSDAAAPASGRPFGQLTSTTNNATLTIGLEANSVVRTGGSHTLQVWSSSQSAGNLSVSSRLGQAPWTPLEQKSSSLPVGQYGRTEIGFAANDVPTKEYNLQVPQGTTVAGVRLLENGATGATVTSIGLGGQSTLSFLNDAWKGEEELARQTFLNRVVDGGSGNLLVMVMEGFNDRNENRASVSGLLPGNSPEAFSDNVKSLINTVASDWAASGLDANKLSFMTFGMYDINGDNALLQRYSDQLRLMAESRSDVSFMDLRAFGPSFADGFANGLYADGVHLSRNGALYYGDAIASTLSSVPEPGSIALVATLIVVGGGCKFRLSRLCGRGVRPD